MWAVGGEGEGREGKECEVLQTITQRYGWVGQVTRGPVLALLAQCPTASATTATVEYSAPDTLHIASLPSTISVS